MSSVPLSPPSSSCHPVTAPRAQFWALSSFPVTPKPTCPVTVFHLSPFHPSKCPKGQLHVAAPSTVIILQVRRLCGRSRMVFNPSTLPPPNLCLPGPLWAHKGPSYKTRGAPPISPRCNVSGCSFTRTVGQWRRGASTPGNANSLLLRTALELGTVIWLRRPGVRTEVSNESLSYSQGYKIKRAH